MKNATLFSHDSDEWATPWSLFDELDKEFQFDMDPCATDENRKCLLFFDKEADGLKQNWGGYHVWCNPPYSQVTSWVRKAFMESRKTGTVVVMLLPARTDTKWFQNFVLHRSEIRFIKGRVKFGGAENNAPFPSMLVIYRGPEVGYESE